MTELAPSAPVRALAPSAAARIRARLQASSPAPWLHAESARRMAERLSLIRTPPQRVLDWSGPAGGSGELLRAACPKASLARVLWPGVPAETEAPWWRRWWPGAAAAAGWQPEEVPSSGLDLVWSAMALHWETDPPAVLRAWRRALAPGGFLMFSTLGPGSLPELRALYQRQGWGSPMAPLVDMHDLGDMLVEAGFADPVMDQEVLTLTWASPQAVLAELRSLGANGDPARSAGCRTPRWRARLEQALAGLAGPDGRIALSFELVYGHAFRAPDKGPKVAPSTEIALDDMKLMLRKPGNRNQGPVESSD